MKSIVEAPDWSTIPVPHDDGAARHLVGARVASVVLSGPAPTSIACAGMSQSGVTRLASRTFRCRAIFTPAAQRSSSKLRSNSARTASTPTGAAET